MKLGAKGAQPPYFLRGDPMLTFRFTGADGEMIQEDMLAAGMIGKKVRFEFSSDWEGLRKVAVYKAGTACCTSVDVGEVDTIPAEVLRNSLHRLFVGVYGISEDGSVVRPAVFAPGPFIHISAVMGDDPCFDPRNTFWIKLEKALEETVRFTPQTLTEEEQAQARKNIGADGSGGMNAAAAKLLLAVLRQAVYTGDVSADLLALEGALSSSGEAGAVYYAVACVLDKVTAVPETASVKEGEAFGAALQAAEGYVLDAVTVTMGGADVTAQVYADGSISIPAVTGNVIIRASAVAEETEAPEEPVVSYTVTLKLTNVTADNSQQTVNAGNSYATALKAAEGYHLDAVTVTMGGVDVTAQVYAGGVVTIPAVTGDVVLTASASAQEEEENSKILFVAASASASTLDAKDPPIRMCTVMLSGVTPFPQYGGVYPGDVYPVSVPADATVMKVVSPGLIGGVQFYTLSGGVYTNTLDTGWQAEGGFHYTIEAGAHSYCIVNFKNSDNSAFFSEDYDTSGISISFE